MNTLWQDLRYGARMLRKQRSLTLVAVVTLALGIGANTALFSVVDAVLLKSLPVAEPDRLVLFEWQAGSSFRTNGVSGTSFVPSPPTGMNGLSLFRHDIIERMKQARATSSESPLSDLFAFAPIREVNTVVGKQAEIIDAQAVSDGYYSGLRVQPIMGRAITEQDDKLGAAPVAILSYQFWKEKFGANPSVIGQTITLNQLLFTIIGVTPSGFNGTLQVDYHPDVTIPIASEPLLLGDRSHLATVSRPDHWWLNLMGRLIPGATYEQARENLNGVFQTAALELMPPPSKVSEASRIDPKEYPQLLAESGRLGMQDVRRWYSTTIYGLFIIVSIVLLIACANIRKFFPSEDVLGKHVTDTDGKRDIEIVSEVSDSKYMSQRSEINPLLYTSWRQEAAEIGEMYFELRAAGEPAALAPSVRQTVREIDSNLPLSEVGTQASRSQATLGQEWLSARFLGFFGGLALLLSAIGLAGVLAASVAQRTKEIGIRMALGARATNVLRLVIWQGMRLVLPGLMLGAAGGYALKRLLASNYFERSTWQAQMAEQLYGVTVKDPLTVACVALLLSLVGLLACWIPARRAAKVDPMVALRYE